jgi:hypothetical protein
MTDPTIPAPSTIALGIGELHWEATASAYRIHAAGGIHSGADKHVRISEPELTGSLNWAKVAMESGRNDHDRRPPQS